MSDISKHNIRSKSFHYDEGGITVTTYIQASTIPVLEIDLERYDSFMSTKIFFHDAKEIGNLIEVLQDLKDEISEVEKDVVY